MRASLATISNDVLFSDPHKIQVCLTSGISIMPRCSVKIIRNFPFFVNSLAKHKIHTIYTVIDANCRMSLMIARRLVSVSVDNKLYEKTALHPEFAEAPVALFHQILGREL